MKSKVYTRTGDEGRTSLVGGKRVGKDSLRLEAYGTIDELNSWIGLLAAADGIPAEQRPVLKSIQHKLFDIGAILATEPESRWQPEPFDQAATKQLEEAIDLMDSELPRHNHFILPGGTADAARANIARTVARRAERRMIAMQRRAKVKTDAEALKYVNRLSDYLFVLSRAINHAAGCCEIFWEK